MHQRTLICTRCGKRQYAAGRVIEEHERELSYTWCVRCLDAAGPIAPALVAPPVQKVKKAKKVKAPKPAPTPVPALVMAASVPAVSAPVDAVGRHRVAVVSKPRAARVVKAPEPPKGAVERFFDDLLVRLFG